MENNMEATPDKELRRLQKAHVTLMRNPLFAFYSGILMVGKSEIVDDIPTAATNGRDVYYGRNFIKELSDKELPFVVLHEASHKMYRHLTVWRKLYDENHQLSNAACDYVINIELHDLDPEQKVIAMPKMGLIDPQYRGMTSKQVYDLLKKKGGGGGGGYGGKGFDEHDWEGAKGLTEAEKEELGKEIDRAIRQGLIAQKKVGKEKGSGSRELEELLEAKVDWREELRDLVKSVCRTKDKSSWRRVNRRFLAGGAGSSDTYMPSMIGETIGRISVAVDTSVSIGSELKDFMSEVKFLAEELRPEGIDLLYWGSSVVGHETYGMTELDGLISSTKPKCGGGTSPSCITDYINTNKLNPEVCIVLTDGEVGNDWGGQWPVPVLWCVVGNRKATSTTGRTIHIDKN
jgi:predicted metal-dependent peptidase